MAPIRKPRRRWNATGQWQAPPESWQYPEDPSFASAVARFLAKERAKSALDVGSGSGAIALTVAAEAGIDVLGVDGNPFSVLESRHFPNGGRVKFRQADVDRPLPLEIGMFDWVMSFAVIEHVPFNYEHIFLANMCRFARHGILLVWDKRGATGTGHINCRNEPEVLSLLDFLGLELDEAATTELRAGAALRWYRLALVFRQRQPSMHSGTPRILAADTWEACTASTKAATDCWHKSDAERGELRKLAELAWREHNRACWPSPWNRFRSACCKTGISMPELNEDGMTSCFGEGFLPQVCCASVDRYYMDWTPIFRIS